MQKEGWAMQDPNDGHMGQFETLEDLYEEKRRSPHKKHWKVLSVGQHVEFAGVHAVVKNITKEIIVLKPVKPPEPLRGDPS